MSGADTGTMRALVSTNVCARSGPRHKANSILTLLMAILPGRRRRPANFRFELELFLPRDALRQVAGPVEKDLAIDDRFFNPRVGAEGMYIEDGQIGVLAGLDGPDASIDTEHPGWINGNQAQRLRFGEAAVLHGLGGLAVEPPSQLVAI